MEADERENPYLKELVHRLLCTVQSKADSTVKGNLQDGKGGKLFFGKTGKIRTSRGPMHVELYLQDLIKDA